MDRCKQARLALRQLQRAVHASNRGYRRIPYRVIAMEILGAGKLGAGMPPEKRSQPFIE
jgi:hypothetical protein